MEEEYIPYNFTEAHRLEVRREEREQERLDTKGKELPQEQLNE